MRFQCNLHRNWYIVHRFYKHNAQKPVQIKIAFVLKMHNELVLFCPKINQIWVGVMQLSQMQCMLIVWLDRLVSCSFWYFSWPGYNFLKNLVLRIYHICWCLETKILSSLLLEVGGTNIGASCPPFIDQLFFFLFFASLL